MLQLFEFLEQYRLRNYRNSTSDECDHAHRRN